MNEKIKQLAKKTNLWDMLDKTASTDEVENTTLGVSPYWSQYRPAVRLASSTVSMT